MMRSILHVDMDAFFAAVEQRDHPALRGQPVIVGGTGRRGVVAAASYEIRSYGVHSAMPVREALRRCPHAICVTPRIDRYRAVSTEIFSILHEFTPQVEGLSLDEAFLDVTHSLSAFGTMQQIACTIKQRIHSRTQLTASVGGGPNKLVAKIASDLRKPDGLMIVTTPQLHSVLDPLPIDRLLGIGAKTAAQLSAINLHTLGALRHATHAQLWPIFGKHTAQLQARAAGEDERPVTAAWDEKQISTEETFATDITEPVQLQHILTALADRTAARLRRKQLHASCVTIKIRRHDFVTVTRQQHFSPPAQDNHTITTMAQTLLQHWLHTHPRVAIRLLGVGVGALSHTQQLELFTTPETQKHQHLDAAVDDIRTRFGTTAVVRAETLQR